MTVSYIDAITAANEDIIERIHRIESHGISEKFRAYEDAADIREVTGRTRLFTIEFRKWPKTTTYFSDVEDTATEAMLVIGYNYGPTFDRGAQADLLAIKHALNNPDSLPEGIAFYLVDEDPFWEDIEGFRWANLPIQIQASTTTQ